MTKKILKNIFWHLVRIVGTYAVIMLSMWLTITIVNPMANHCYVIDIDTWLLMGIATVLFYAIGTIVNYVIAKIQSKIWFERTKKREMELKN